MNTKPTLLIILDGWGIRKETDFNAIARAETPVFDRLISTYPSSLLGASGRSVGLPDGQMGNSEVGHLNLGAGRIVYQDYTRINLAVDDGSFAENKALSDLFSTIKSAGGALHLIGLLSDGGVHSHITHIFAVIQAARSAGIDRLFIHPLMDGRDTPPTSGIEYMKMLVDFLSSHDYGRIASVAGRFFGMDRDNRWDRVQKSYDVMVLGRGRRATDPVQAMRESYDAGETDEFITPTVIVDDAGPVGTISDNDGVFFINFRADRAREMTRALAPSDLVPPFDQFPREIHPKLSGYLTMTRYDDDFNLPMAFPPISLERILGGIVSDAGLSQLRIAETEKYAHVTFFFSGGEERLFPLEDRELIPSPQDVPTYDLKPRMSADLVASRAVSLIQERDYGLIVLNFANPDMVGHTGVMEAAVDAVEAVDECLGRVVDAAQTRGMCILITADHGNAEEMWDYENNEPHTAHTTNPVPLILVDDDLKHRTLKNGILADVAPTILTIMDVTIPDQITGSSLLE
ncbi:MAG: 2,3-bisphosphoglycerate-independent phosphoglycerate mutase [Deltaproteobacteria bacterium]|nr:2,3-bisphosphoglycerate-independent phosphoglycerate mutase [Candidatus Zymogenaceae bacterium]